MSMLPQYYRRDGTLYPPGEPGLFQWCEDLRDGKNVVRQDQLDDGSFVSTVWIGLDMDHYNVLRHKPHAPLIFETMTWDRHDAVIDQRRWATENDAIIGHMEAVDRQKAKVASETN